MSETVEKQDEKSLSDKKQAESVFILVLGILLGFGFHYAGFGWVLGILYGLFMCIAFRAFSGLYVMCLFLSEAFLIMLPFLRKSATTMHWDKMTEFLGSIKGSDFWVIALLLFVSISFPVFVLRLAVVIFKKSPNGSPELLARIFRQN